MAQPITQEIGRSGIQLSGGNVYDLALRDLYGPQGRLKLNEMRETDSVAGAMVTATTLPCLNVKWDFEPANDSAQAQAEAEFAQSVLDDMSHHFADAVSDALTMTTFGWSFLETVWKRRVGPEEKDPTKRSRFTDGRVGLRKLAGRSQLTLSKWELDETGGVQAFVQQSGDARGEIPIPIDRGLLFRTTRESGSVEGRSILKTAYLSWKARRFLEGREFVAMDRELTGTPIVRVPMEYLTPDPNPAAEAARATTIARYHAIASQLRLNEQGGLVLPSDPWMDAAGSPTGLLQYPVELMASAGTRTLDIGGTIVRLNTDMFRSILADFFMLGTAATGSYALSKDKSSLFLQSVNWFLDVIADTINRHLMPRLWLYNGLSPDLMPMLKHGEAAPVDLDKLGNFVRSISGAGVTFDDDETQNRLRGAAELPELDPEQFEELRADEKEAARLASETQRAALEEAGSGGEE